MLDGCLFRLLLFDGTAIVVAGEPLRKRSALLRTDGEEIDLDSHDLQRFAVENIEHGIFLRIPFVLQQDIEVGILSCHAEGPGADRNHVHKAESVESLRDCTAHNLVDMVLDDGVHVESGNIFKALHLVLLVLCRLFLRDGLLDADGIHINTFHIGSGIHFRLESFHAREVSRSVVYGFQIRTDSIAQVGNHALGEVHEFAGTCFHMVCGHLCTDEEHFGVESSVELAQFLHHALFQFLVFLGRDDGVLRAVGRRSRLFLYGRGDRLLRGLVLRLRSDKAVIEFGGTAHHVVLGFLADAVLPHVGKDRADFLRHILAEEVLVSLQRADHPRIVSVAGKGVEGLLDVRKRIFGGFLLLGFLLRQFHLDNVVDEALRLVEGLAVHRRFTPRIVKEPAHVINGLL